MSNKNKKTGILVKIYLIFLFICGIAVWFITQPSDKQTAFMGTVINKNINKIKHVKQKNLLKGIKKYKFNTLKGRSVI